MLLDDNPILNGKGDRFNFLPHADVLCQAIKKADMLPLTIGILGAWGTGKSSFLNICREILSQPGEKEFITAFFNPWKYDKRHEVWHALIQTLLGELIRRADELPDEERERFRDKVGQLSAVVAWLAARLVIPPMTAGYVSAGDVDKVKESLASLTSGTAEDRYTLGYRHVNQFEEDFAETVKILTGDRRLVIFIDDLDRCQPEQALMLLEALRLFIGDARCIFIIALDHKSISAAAAARFNDAAKGRQYLEKLISFSYYLPVATQEAIIEAMKPFLVDLADDHAMWELIQISFAGNPRRIKRFITAFNVSVETLVRLDNPISRDLKLQVAMLVMLRQEHPEFLVHVMQDDHAWGRLESFAMDDTGKARLTDEDEDLTRSDPALLKVIAGISSKRDIFKFPSLPSRDRINMLTEAILLPQVGLQG